MVKLCCIILLQLLYVSTTSAFETEASYYTMASCLREGTSGICANGERLNDEALTAASWDYKFGTVLRVTRLDRKDLSVLVKITDRGPSRKLYRKGRRLDLSKRAMELLGGINKGIIRVEVTEVK